MLSSSPKYVTDVAYVRGPLSISISSGGLIAPSGVSGWGVGAPFWGLIAGIAVHRFSEIRGSRQNH